MSSEERPQRPTAPRESPARGQDNAGALEPQADLPPPPPPAPPRLRRLGKIWAIAGIVAGFLFFVVPGVFALRSYRRWKAGSIHRPTLAWTCAWIGVPLLALGAYSSWALYNVPVLEDDFSDPASGWLVKAGPDWSVGYEEGAYHIDLRGPDSNSTFLRWSEGALPNVAVEADVLLRSGDRATSGAIIGCLDTEGAGYGFGIGDDSAGIFRFDKDRDTGIATADLPPTVWVTGATNRIRGECRAGFGGTRLTMYVNGTKVAEATELDEGEYRAFTGIALGVQALTDNKVDVDFDNALVIAIQPS